MNLFLRLKKAIVDEILFIKQSIELSKNKITNGEKNLFEEIQKLHSKKKRNFFRRVFDSMPWYTPLTRISNMTEEELNKSSATFESTSKSIDTHEVTTTMVTLAYDSESNAFIGMYLNGELTYQNTDNVISVLNSMPGIQAKSVRVDLGPISDSNQVPTEESNLKIVG